MTFPWIIVTRSDGRGAGEPYFVNGNYVDAAGKLGIACTAETGANLFEVLNPDNTIGWRKDKVIENPPPGLTPEDPVAVVLEPIA